jgi:transcriptional regulator with XRE-family HTH domain
MHGLRREEVAALSTVSVTWYTWLEQGRISSEPVGASVRSGL